MDPRHFWLYHKIEPKKVGGRGWTLLPLLSLALSSVVRRCLALRVGQAICRCRSARDAVELPSLRSSVARTLVEMAEKSVGRTKDRRERRTEHNFACGNYDRERTRKFPEMGHVTVEEEEEGGEQDNSHPQTNKITQLSVGVEIRQQQRNLSCLITTLMRNNP